MSDDSCFVIDINQIQLVLPETVKPVYPRNMVIGQRYKVTFANNIFGNSKNEFYGNLVKKDDNGLIYLSQVSYLRELSIDWNSPDIIPLYTANYIFYKV